MRLFVCEFVTGGGLSGEALPPDLCREGEAMLQALVKDLLDVPGVSVIATRDSRLPHPDLAVDWHWIAATGAVWPRWQQLTEASDVLWPIAPETDRALERLSRLAYAAGRRLIGSDPETLRLTASKAATTAHLRAHGIAAVPTGSAAEPPASEQGWVVKPDDGAGCEETWLLRDRCELARWDGKPGCVVQPFVPGLPASLSLLCGGGEARLLSSNRQEIVVEDGRFRHLGGSAGVAQARHEDLAARIAAALPGLWGYVGVDFIETADGPVVLEINPRLTASYAGLRAVLGANPASLVLDLLETGSLEPGVRLQHA